MTCARCSPTSTGRVSEGAPRPAGPAEWTRRERGGRGAAPAARPGAARDPVRRRRPPPGPAPIGRRASGHRGDGRRPHGARPARRPARGAGVARMSLVEPELAERALARALARGGDLGEVYAEERRGFGLSLDDRRVERPQTGLERGAAIRVVGGDSTYFGHVDGLREDDILRAADSVAQALSQEGREPRELKAAEPAEGHPVGQRPEEVDVALKADLLRACDERARSAGAEVTQVSASYAEARRVVEVYNSDGVAAADDRTRVRLGVQVVARRDGTVETGHETLGGHAGFELVAERPEEVAEKAARKALTMLDAVDAPTGRLPVVVGNGFGGVLLHEAVGHGLESDAVPKRASVYAG